MSCQLCGSGNTSSLSTHFTTYVKHIYCHKCGGHEYDGRLIEKADWDDWVNERVEEPRSRPVVENSTGSTTP